MVLNLTKYGVAHYGVAQGNVEISINNPYRSTCKTCTNAWQMVITIKDEEMVNEYFPTKKQASEWGAKWVQDNMDLIQSNL